MKAPFLKKYLLVACLAMLLCKICFNAQYPFALVVFMLFTFPVSGFSTIIQQYELSSYVEEHYPEHFKSRKYPSGLIDGSSIKYSKDPMMREDQELKALLHSFKELQYLTGLSFVLIIPLALIIYI